jgi:hypothetical protein
MGTIINRLRWLGNANSQAERERAADEAPSLGTRLRGCYVSARKLRWLSHNGRSQRGGAHAVHEAPKP